MGQKQIWGTGVHQATGRVVEKSDPKMDALNTCPLALASYMGVCLSTSCECVCSSLGHPTRVLLKCRQKHGEGDDSALTCPPRRAMQMPAKVASFCGFQTLTNRTATASPTCALEIHEISAPFTNRAQAQHHREVMSHTSSMQLSCLTLPACTQGSRPTLPACNMHSSQDGTQGTEVYPKVVEMGGVALLLDLLNSAALPGLDDVAHDLAAVDRSHAARALDGLVGASDCATGTASTDSQQHLLAQRVCMHARRCHASLSPHALQAQGRSEKMALSTGPINASTED